MQRKAKVIHSRPQYICEVGDTIGDMLCVSERCSICGYCRHHCVGHYGLLLHCQPVFRKQVEPETGPFMEILLSNLEFFDVVREALDG